MQKDLDFISGKFFDQEIPKSQMYLLKYFKTDLQIAFLRYYLTFNEHGNFIDHTGFVCSERWRYMFQARYHKLIDMHKEAKSALTEESMLLVDQIESGKYKWNSKSGNKD